MKRYFFLSFVLSFYMAIPCLSQNIAIERLHFADSAKYSSFFVDIDCPVSGSNWNSLRNELMAELSRNMNGLSDFDGNTLDGALTDISDFEGFCRKYFNFFNAAAADIADIPWYSSLRIDKGFETTNLCVFCILSEIYMGGAHGGAGMDCLIFDKTTGQKIDNILREGCVDEIKPLLVKGLCQYFEVPEKDLFSDCLLCSYDELQLPYVTPCPMADGLYFEYQQYEIAPYASGSPNFTISYDEIKPFLSERISKLF